MMTDLLSRSPAAPIALVYHSGCPRLGEARILVRRALEALGLPPAWTEWNQQDPECPEACRRLPSPAIRVAGHPTESGVPGAASCSLEPLPRLDELVMTLESALGRRGIGRAP